MSEQPRYTVGSLFSGIGGIDLAFERASFSITWQVEIDPYCTRILTRHWPHVQRHGDIRTASAAVLPRVDVMVGGFPCQDISVAGRGAGIAEGTRSGLWFEFRRLIGDLRPRAVLLENVAAITGRGGADVLADLAALGYDAEWGIIRAADAGAPHERERWFLVAYANSGTLERNRAVWQQVAEARHQKAQPQGRAGRSGAEKRVRLASVGRDANGLPARLDSHRWPAGQGAKQHDYEPPRLSATCEKPRLKALGNAVVPQVVYPIAVAIREYLEAQDAGEA